MTNFHLTIRTPDKDVFTGDISSLSFNAEDGRLQVLAHHANFVTTLQFSSLKLTSESKEITYVARNGMFTFDHAKNSALLLCLYCEEQSEVNYQTVEEYLTYLTGELAKGGELSDYQVLYLQGEKLAVEKQVKLAK